jgi:hypothetical protein
VWASLGGVESRCAPLPDGSCSLAMLGASSATSRCAGRTALAHAAPTLTLSAVACPQASRGALRTLQSSWLYRSRPCACHASSASCTRPPSPNWLWKRSRLGWERGGGGARLARARPRPHRSLGARWSPRDCGRTQKRACCFAAGEPRPRPRGGAPPHTGAHLVSVHSPQGRMYASMTRRQSARASRKSAASPAAEGGAPGVKGQSGGGGGGSRRQQGPSVPQSLLQAAQATRGARRRAHLPRSTASCALHSAMVLCQLPSGSPRSEGCRCGQQEAGRRRLVGEGGT